MIALGGEQTWAFVQSIGGLKVGAPTRQRDSWVLPVVVNVSGLEAITRKPTTLNSALICDRTNVAVKGNSVYVTISTAVTPSEASVHCPPAMLGSIRAGIYAVNYLGPGEAPTPIGEISIER
jgi:hypothetical protein